MLNEKGGGEAIVILLIGLAVCFVCIFAAVLGGGLGEDFLDDKESVRIAEMREWEMEQAKQERLTAQEETKQAEARLEEARQEKEREQALARQIELEAALELAAGQKAQDMANAYTTRRMADAAFNTIQRQGQLMSLSYLQYVFFGVVAALVVIFAPFLWIALRDSKPNLGGYTVLSSSYSSSPSTSLARKKRIEWEGRHE